VFLVVLVVVSIAAIGFTESISAEAGSKIVASKCMVAVHKVVFGCVCF
jgi:hypothetical protein